MENEILVDAIGFEGLYSLSSDGRVFSLLFNKKRELKKIKDSNGYFFVALWKNKKRHTKWVHRLVYESFNSKTDLQIDHINEIKTDNRLSNLQAITQRQNISKNRLTKNKHSKFTGVTLHKKSNKFISRIQINKKLYNLGYFTTEIDAANAYQNALKQTL